MPLAHLTIRVAWHDSVWAGSVCAQPSLNSFCATLDRIRASKSEGEDSLAGFRFDKLTQEQLPPCKAESGFFMSPHPWLREFEHPYNTVRPHSRIGWLTPKAYAARFIGQRGHGAALAEGSASRSLATDQTDAFNRQTLVPTR